MPWIGRTGPGPSCSTWPSGTGRRRSWARWSSTRRGCPSRSRGRTLRGASRPRRRNATGLRPGTPVVAGGGDQAAAAVGLGSVEPGVSSLSLGTSGVVFATTERPTVEPNGRLHAFCHAVPDRWHLMGVMLSAAGSLRWYRDAIAPGTGFGELVDEAAAVPAGSDGLLFLPYLSGERTPHPDPRARGAFVGLTVHHTRAHLTRAVLEGVAFGLRDSLELMRSIGLPPAYRGPGHGRRRPAACGGRSWRTSSAPGSPRPPRPRGRPRARRRSPRRARAGTPRWKRPVERSSASTRSPRPPTTPKPTRRPTLDTASCTLP